MVRCPKPLAIIGADTHLDELIFRSRPEISGDSFYGFEQLIDLTVSESVALILAGDVNETLPVNTPSATTIAFLNSQLDRLVNAGLDLFATEGQHDVKYPSWVESHGRFKSADLLSTRIGGYLFSFLSHRPSRLLPDAISGLDPETDVMICHQVWAEFFGGPGTEGSLLDLPGKVVISGDMHKYEELTLTREDGSSFLAISPGATHLRKINEPDEHYAIILNDDLTVSRKKLRSRPVVRRTITSEKDYEEVYQSLPGLLKTCIEELKSLPPKLQTPILHITDSSDIPEVEARIKKVIKDDFHLFYSKKAIMSVPVPIHSDLPGPRESLLRCAEEEIGDDPEVKDLLMEALKVEDFRSEIDKYRGRFVEH